MVKEVFIGRNLKGITDMEDFSLGSWPEPDVGTLCSRDLDRFLKRKEAVVLYLQGAASDLRLGLHGHRHSCAFSQSHDS